MRKMAWMIAAGLLALVTACGGGDDDSPSSADSGPDTDTPAPVADGPSATPTASNAANAIPITVTHAANRPINFPVVSVKLCKPGSTAPADCAVIDNVLLDTGSYGLRLFASAIPAHVRDALPRQTQGAKTVAECAVFVDSYAWGTVRDADLHLADEVAPATPIHVLSDPALAAAEPEACRQGAVLDDKDGPDKFGGNGILGLGHTPADCPSCATVADDMSYYACEGAVCTPTTQPVNRQVGNPVVRFAQHNNGVVVQLPPIGPLGQDTVVGTLVLGIDTAANNALSGTDATVLRTDLGGTFNATYKGRAIQGFTDSGSNGYYFDDASIPESRQFASFYAPDPSLSLPLAVNDVNAAAGAAPVATIPVGVASVDTLLRSAHAAYNNLAGNNMPNAFDLGLPFFFGRHVYYGVAGTTSPGGGAGPYLAYVSE